MNRNWLPRCLIGTALLSLVRAAFGSDWPMYQRDPGHTGYTPDPLRFPLAVKWGFRTDRPIMATPIVVGERVLVGCTDLHFYCLARNDGKVLWRFPASGKISRSAAYVSGRVYFASEDGVLWCLEIESGRLCYQRSLAGRTISAPALDDGTLFLGDMEGNATAWRAADGDLLWTYQAPEALWCSPAADQERIYFTSLDRHLYAVDRRTGKLQWKFFLDDEFLSSSPTVCDGVLVIGDGHKAVGPGLTEDRSLYGIDTRTGHQLWKYHIDYMYSNPWYYNSFRNTTPGIWKQSLVLINSTQHIRVALELKTGRQVWENRDQTRTYEWWSRAIPVSSCPGAAVIVSSGVGTWISGIDPAMGQMLWKGLPKPRDFSLRMTANGMQGLFAAAVIADNHAYLSTIEGLICYVGAGGP